MRRRLVEGVSLQKILRIPFYPHQEILFSMTVLLSYWSWIRFSVLFKCSLLHFIHHALFKCNFFYMFITELLWLFQEKNCRRGKFSPSKLKGKRVVELGAGCGVAGFSEFIFLLYYYVELSYMVFYNFQLGMGVLQFALPGRFCLI